MALEKVQAWVLDEIEVNLGRHLDMQLVTRIRKDSDLFCLVTLTVQEPSYNQCSKRSHKF